MEREPLLELVGITKHYQRPDGTTFAAVNGVDLRLHAGRAIAIVGESGSGKSTLARVLLQLVPADGGTVRFEGRPLDRRDREQMAGFRRAVQPIFQDPAAAFNPRRNTLDAIVQALRQAAGGRRPGEAAAAAAVLEQVRLTPAADFLPRYPHELSGGQRQRLAIARALAMAPRVIIADEPLSGADASIRGQVLNLLADLRDERGMAIVMITHDIRVAAAFADHVLVMHRGEVVEEGAAAAVLEAPAASYTRGLIAAIPDLDRTDNLTRYRDAPFTSSR